MALLGRIERGSNAWAVGRLDEPTMQALLPNQVVSRIPALARFAAGVRINGGMSGTLTADARDDEAGQNLRDVLTGFLALAKVSAGSRPELQPLLDSFQLSGVGTTVTMSFWLPSEVIAAVAASKRARGAVSPVPPVTPVRSPADAFRRTPCPRR